MTTHERCDLRVRLLTKLKELGYSPPGELDIIVRDCCENAQSSRQVIENLSANIKALREIRNEVILTYSPAL